MTRGGAGLWNGRATGDLRRLSDVRELELRDAAAELGVRSLEVLDYPDGVLEKVEEVDAVRERFIGDIVRCLRLHRPQVVVCFGPEGAYGHPDHKVVSRLTVQACALSGDPAAFELEALALGLLPWSPSSAFSPTGAAPPPESWRFPRKRRSATVCRSAGVEKASWGAWAPRGWQARGWEPHR